MPLSLAYVLVHLVFSTKERRPVLDEAIRPALFAYMATVARGVQCECYRVGGIADHVHLAIRLSRRVSLAALVEEVKTSSSRWMKKQSPEFEDFAWQRGYGVFSVGPRHCDALVAYIDRQAIHHRNVSFQDELRGLFRRYGVAFDERYLWD